MFSVQSTQLQANRDMPLDASDIEKITTIVERATMRVETDIKLLMPRTEYEARHNEIYTRVQKNEQSITDIVKWAMSENEKLHQKIDSRFDVLATDIASLKADISSQRITTIRYMVTILVSIGLGIAIPVLIKLLGG